MRVFQRREHPRNGLSRKRIQTQLVNMAKNHVALITMRTLLAAIGDVPVFDGGSIDLIDTGTNGPKIPRGKRDLSRRCFKRGYGLKGPFSLAETDMVGDSLNDIALRRDVLTIVGRGDSDDADNVTEF